MSETISKIQAVANLLKIPLEKFAQDVFDVCAFLETNGNSGYELTALVSANAREDVRLELYWMNPGVLGDALEGICFYSKPSRNSDYSGWYVKRRPQIREVWAWRVQWLATFGGESETGKQIQQQIETEQTIEANTPKREHNRWWLETAPTVEIAHMWAASMLLAHFFYGEYGEHSKMRNASSSFQRWIAATWMEEANIMRSELEYRFVAEPQDRGSKTKTNKARADFRAAKDFLESGIDGIYGWDYQNMVKTAAFPFDLGVDFDHLPEPAPENKPIRFMKDHELVTSFFKYLDEDYEQGSFEWEDRNLLLDNLRKQYARIKGQKIEKE
jgi:hypothetical protein